MHVKPEMSTSQCGGEAMVIKTELVRSSGQKKWIHDDP